MTSLEFICEISRTCSSVNEQQNAVVCEKSDDMLENALENKSIASESRISLSFHLPFSLVIIGETRSISILAILEDILFLQAISVISVFSPRSSMNVSNYVVTRYWEHVPHLLYVLYRCIVKIMLVVVSSYMDNDEKSNYEVWEFQRQHFQQRFNGDVIYLVIT